MPIIRTKKCKDCHTLILSSSLHCKACYIKHRRSYKGKKSPVYKHGKTLVKTYCIDCNTLLSKHAHFYGYKRCLSCSQSFKVKGTKHPNYIDGRKKTLYPKEFNAKLKEEIRHRDKYTCQNPSCRITQKVYKALFGMQLSPHHIDYNKFNNKKSNLITLCNPCNVKANYKREYYQKLYTRIVNKNNADY